MNANNIANLMQKSAERWRKLIGQFIGKEITDGGERFELVGCNELGTLYWQKKGRSRITYVIGGWDIDRLLWEALMPSNAEEAEALLYRAMAHAHILSDAIVIGEAILRVRGEK